MDAHPDSLGKQARRPGRSVVIAAALVLASAACAGTTAGSGDGQSRDEAGASVDIPSSGVFPTSAEHFDRVLASGSLPTVVNVWASWCIPCRTEKPILVRAAARYEGQVRLVGLNTQDDEAAALDFIEEFGIPYPNGLDPSGSVARHLRILGLPATYFYRSGGELAFVHQGELRARDLNDKISELLRSSSTAGPSP